MPDAKNIREAEVNSNEEETQLKPKVKKAMKLEEVKNQITELLNDGEWVGFLGFMALVATATTVVGNVLLFVLMSQ